MHRWGTWAALQWWSAAPQLRPPHRCYVLPAPSQASDDNHSSPLAAATRDDQPYVVRCRHTLGASRRHTSAVGLRSLATTQRTTSYMRMRAGNCGRYYHAVRHLRPLPSSRAISAVSSAAPLQHSPASRRPPGVCSTVPLRPAAAALSSATHSAAAAVTAMQAAPPPPAHAPPPGRQLLSVAPMMDWTDTHYRQLARIISRRTWLWTEMVSARRPGGRRCSSRRPFTAAP